MSNIESHRLDKLLGPSGSFGGWVILLTGLVALFASWTAVFLVLIGAFAAFTGTMTIIDFGNRRVKYATALFGLIRFGRWIEVEETMTIRVRQSGRSQTVYSRSNRPLSLGERDFSVVLKDSGGREICPLLRFKSRQAAEEVAVELAGRLQVRDTTHDK